MKLTKELYGMYLDVTAERIEVSVLNQVYCQGQTLSQHIDSSIDVDSPINVAYELAEIALSEAGIEIE